MTKKDPTAEKFLLYIDILGFTEMAIKEPRKVERIFATIDSLNVHQHGAFKTIVFSDTILVYNNQPAVTLQAPLRYDADSPGAGRICFVELGQRLMVRGGSEGHGTGYP